MCVLEKELSFSYLSHSQFDYSLLWVPVLLEVHAGASGDYVVTDYVFISEVRAGLILVQQLRPLCALTLIKELAALKLRAENPLIHHLVLFLFEVLQGATPEGFGLAIGIYSSLVQCLEMLVACV